MRRFATPRRLAALAAAIAVSGLVGCATAPPPAPPSSPSALLGAPLPAFRRSTLGGATSFDTTTVGPRLLVVDFFASYCGPCQRALPALESLHASRPDVAIVGVSLDDDEPHAARVVARHHLTFPVVLDGGHTLAGKFRVTELPAAFVADRGGRVVWSAGPGAAENALPTAVAALESAP
ncbi:MAG TPA: TlpA disulfide reductase family protein [Polyangia bacterium]|nr:TlpA disulfide reductase family protein [Polyangia bacterium]